MIIGTVRIEESETYNSHAGYHSFHADETQEEYGSFEVFWVKEEMNLMCVEGHGVTESYAAGWYWAAGFPGCLYDGDPVGPFASSQQAHEDADEWAPEYDA